MEAIKSVAASSMTDDEKRERLTAIVNAAQPEFLVLFNGNTVQIIEMDIDPESVEFSQGATHEGNN